MCSLECLPYSSVQFSEDYMEPFTLSTLSQPMGVSELRVTFSSPTQFIILCALDFSWRLGGVQGVERNLHMHETICIQIQLN